MDCNKCHYFYKNVTMTCICDMYENAKTCLIMKMVRFFLKWKTTYSLDFRKEINEINFISRHVRNSFFYWNLYSPQTHRTNFNDVDLNVCAQTCHSVSVVGHKQGFELAVPELIKIIITVNYLLYNNTPWCYQKQGIPEKNLRKNLRNTTGHPWHILDLS